MNKPALMHGSDWSGQDVSGWWISEKLDGWRCLWTGREFLTREGNPLDAPAWFLAGMPAQPLDGELWAGPGTTHNDVNRAVLSGDWLRLSFRPFDVPALGVKIEAAQATLASLALPAHVLPVTSWQVCSTEAVIEAMRRVVASGGEGVMARKPGSGYAPNFRTEKLLKFKPAIVAAVTA